MKKINVVLTPSWDGLKIPELRVDIHAEITAKAKEMVFGVNEVTIFKPFTTLKDAIAIADEEGSVEYETEMEQHGPIQYKKYLAARNTAGELHISYTLILDAAGKNPVFDMGYEPGGMTGSGMTFMPQFPEETYEYTLDWDLLLLPVHCIGAWSFGEGRITKTGSEDLLMRTFYSAGKLDGVKCGNFRYYWLENDNILSLAVSTSQIFRYESKFFEDEGEIYTIFSRHTAATEKRAGGTALTRSYMYLYQDDSQLDPSWIKFLFAHEMVHNWVQLYDTPFGTCTWYVEGMAEYYSALLPWRMGIVTKEELTHELNKRAAQYYENPRISCTNKEAGAKLMADPEMTRIPYGRGFFYLTHADGMIRKATKGEKCLDDVMRTLLKENRTNPKIGNEDWIHVYGEFVGETVAREEYETFSQGGEVIPDVACYEGAIALEETEGSVRGTESKCKLWRFV